jgi:hypothetical protein
MVPAIKKEIPYNLPRVIDGSEGVKKGTRDIKRRDGTVRCPHKTMGPDTIREIPYNLPRVINGS